MYSSNIVSMHITLLLPFMYISPTLACTQQKYTPSKTKTKKTKKRWSSVTLKMPSQRRFQSLRQIMSRSKMWFHLQASPSKIRINQVSISILPTCRLLSIFTQISYVHLDIWRFFCRPRSEAQPPDTHLAHRTQRRPFFPCDLR